MMMINATSIMYLIPFINPGSPGEVVMPFITLLILVSIRFRTMRLRGKNEGDQ